MVCAVVAVYPKGGNLPARRLDLLGVRCPANWARAKAALETGERLELFTDDPRALADIPRAAEAEGHAVIEAWSEDGVVHVAIER